jgi:DNA invertase Pin-like site-specific DNA recombinase
MYTNNNAFIFDRVSSADQRDGFSLEAQKEMSFKYALQNSLKVLRHWSVDESAAKHNERKHFNEMFRLAVELDVKHIVFDKVDRACRNLESAVAIEKLVTAGVKFHFVREHLVIDNNSASHDKMRFYLGIILSTYYIDNLKAEIKKGLDQRTKVGLWNHKAPFGYINIRDPKSNRASVVVDPIHGDIAKNIFEMYSTGNYVVEKLVEYLKSKIPGKITTPRLIGHMLTNPFYYGALPKGREQKPVAIGQHEPLITKELFDKCQKIKSLRALNSKYTTHQEISKPLMGIFKCGKCDHAVTGERHTKTSGKTFVYYHCANQKCEERRKNIPQQKIFEQIQMAFEPFAHFTPKATNQFITSLQGRLEELDVFTLKVTSELAVKRLEVKKSIDKLENLHRQGHLTKDELAEVMRIKTEALAEVKLEIDAYNEADHKTFQVGLRLIELFTTMRNYMKNPGNELDKARLAKLVLSNPTLKDGTIDYDYGKPFDVLINLTSEKNWWRQ